MNHNSLYKAVFGEERVVENYKYVPHYFTGKICGKSYCVKCGLIALNNPFSEWGVDKGCLSSVHQSYASKRRKLVVRRSNEEI